MTFDQAIAALSVTVGVLVVADRVEVFYRRYRVTQTKKKRDVAAKDLAYMERQQRLAQESEAAFQRMWGEIFRCIHDPRFFDLTES